MTMSRFLPGWSALAVVANLSLVVLPLLAQIRAVEGNGVEKLPDGSEGRVMEFRGSDDSFIPAYLRRPNRQDAVPVVVLLHGGAASKDVTYSLGRAAIPPVADFVAAGWAVFCIDFRSQAAQRTSEWGDTIAAIEAVKRLPSIDKSRVTLFGGSHGAGVLSRLASRTDAQCAPWKTGGTVSTSPSWTTGIRRALPMSPPKPKRPPPGRWLLSGSTSGSNAGPGTTGRKSARF